MNRGTTLALLAVVAAGWLASCRHAAAPAGFVAPLRFGVFVEATGEAAVPVTLPQSGVTLLVDPAPAVALEEVARVEAVSLGLGSGFVLTLQPDFRAAFVRLAEARGGQRLVLVVDDRAIGAKRIDDAARAGRCDFLVEMSEAELSDLAATLNSSIAAAAKRRPSAR